MMTVRLIAHTPEPEKVVAAAAKLCYSDAHITDLLDGLTEEKTAKFLTMLSDLGHASPIEHASFTFGIEGVSRTLLAQITRHRIASFSVQSQRYVRLDDFRYVVPPEIEAIPEAKEAFLASMEEDAKRYLDLAHKLEEGHTARLMAEGMPEKQARAKASKQANEDARFVLPNACETKMVVTMNARSLQNFFHLRCCSRAQWEIRELAEKIYAVEGGLRRQKSDAVQAYFSEYRESLRLPADIASYDFAGINVTLTASEKSLKKQAKDYLDRIREDLTLIDTLPDRDEVLAEYRKCMSVSKAVQAVRDRHARIEAERQRRLEAEEAARKTQEHTAEVEQVIAEEEELAVPEPAEAPADEFHAPVVEPDSEENAAEEAPAEPEATPANRFAVSFRVVGTIDQLKAMKKFLIDGGYEYEQLD